MKSRAAATNPRRSPGASTLERADVDDDAFGVETGHRQHRSSAVVELVIVVVLDNGESAMGGETQELHAPAAPASRKASHAGR